MLIPKKKPGPSKRNYFKTTITLPPALVARVHRHSLKHSIPHTQIYREAVEAYLGNAHDRNG